MKTRRWLRPVLVAIVVVVWLGISSAGGQTFGKLSSVQENENSVFLPSSAESTQAAVEHAQFVPADAVPGLFVIDDVTPAHLGEVDAWLDSVGAVALEGDPEGRSVRDVLASDPIAVPAEDGEAVLVIFEISADAFGENAGEGTIGELVVTTVRHQWAQSGLDSPAYFTGAAGLVADLVGAFAGIDGILLLVALSVVLLILLIVYRSPVLPFLVLATAMIALTAAIIAVYALAKNDVITLNGQSQGIMFILVVGATTDYALLLVARYREELLRRRSTYEALRVAWRRSIEPIAASAGTVILGVLVLLLSDLKSNSSLGPAGAIGIASALLAALTLLPALLLLGGEHARGVFWPARPVYVGADTTEEAMSTSAVERSAGVWGRVSTFVDSRPRIVWMGAAGLLVLMSVGLTQLEADGVGDRDVFLAETESVTGFDVLEEHFDAGASSPVRVIVDESDAEAVLAAVAAVPGIEEAYMLTPSIVEGALAQEAQDAPIVVNGRVEIDAVTATAASTRASQDVVEDVRAAVHELSDSAVVGGQAAEALDTRLTTDRDIVVILPVILLVIFLVLMLLLRSIVAPALIVLANILSFGAAMGVSALVFDWIFDFPGVDPTVPLLAFVFLVALGVDYSIFLMSRAREEALAHGTADGVRRALAVTGGVITSAGIVLAATFAALGVLPLIFLAQIAFIVAFGVLVDTFIVRSLLMPGLIADIGRRSWWPWMRRFQS